MRFRVSALSAFASHNHRILVKLADKKTKIVLIKDEGLITAMDATCPHSGGPLENGVVEAVLLDDLEDIGSNGCRGVVKAGVSLDDDIFRASVYPVHVDLEDDIYLELPDPDIIESILVFTVDHALDEVPQLSANLADLSTTAAATTEKEKESIDQILDRLKGMSLFDWCLAILGCENAEKKVRLTLELQRRWTSNEIIQIKREDSSTSMVPDRPARNKDLEFVDPSKVKRRGKGSGLTSRITILHALANVEQWAIDLAIDIMCRFSTESFQSPDGVDFPIADQREFFTDFIKVAAEEAKHFTYLVERLNALGAKYGDLPCHQGLWDAATQTKDSLMARLAIVHMVHEARGLDVNPNTIEKFRKAGDVESVVKLEEIHQDEITHVATGQRWFAWASGVQGTNRYQAFHKLVVENYWGHLKPPFNEQDRTRAGLDPQYYLPLTEEEAK